MVDTYNLTNLTNSEDMSAIFSSVNAFTNNYLVIGSLLAIWFIAFAYFYVWGVKESLSTATFGTLILAIVMNTFVAVNGWILLVLIIGTAVCAVSLLVDNGYGV